MRPVPVTFTLDLRKSGAAADTQGSSMEGFGYTNPKSKREKALWLFVACLLLFFVLYVVLHNLV